MCRETSRTALGFREIPKPPSPGGPVPLRCRTLPCRGLTGLPWALSLRGVMGMSANVACHAWSPSIPVPEHPDPQTSQAPSIPAPEHPCPVPFARAAASQPLKSLITEPSGCKEIAERRGEIIARLGVIGSQSVSCPGFGRSQNKTEG